MPSPPSSRQLNGFFLISWTIALIQILDMNGSGLSSGPALTFWTIATACSYAFFYLLPALLLVQLARRLLSGLRWPSCTRFLLPLWAIGLTSFTQLLLYADRLIHGMYGFHINGFIINLIVTPGGIASLGATPPAQLTAAAIALMLITMQTGAYLWATRCNSMMRLADSIPWRRVVLTLILLSLGERLAYAYSSAINFQPVLFASEHYPLYQPLTLRKLAIRLGIASRHDKNASLHLRSNPLSYPLVPLRVEAPAKPPNIVWLVAESLRFDMLDPKIMPRLWAFSSNDALRLEKHYSGGNLTQMGVFSMFYGLYGNYWFPMRAAERPPVLMDTLQAQHYQFSLYTSQRFTYPAFDKTIFVNMRPEDLHPFESGPPPRERDTINITRMLDFIDTRDPAHPFMTYMFFESTHAPYDFPPGEAIARPYLENFNYLTADFTTQTPQIKNRYINAAHHVDGQIGRVIDYLGTKHLLDSTIVIVLGDHGEEFMERGRWGHSAEFNRFQAGTPAVLHIPGQAARVITGITSHLDIPATLMPLLGVKNPPGDYSNGFNLLTADFHRDYAVAADWNRVAYLGENFKVSFPVNALGAIRNQVTDGDDRPLKNSQEVIQAIRAAMVDIMGNLARFSRTPP